MKILFVLSYPGFLRYFDSTIAQLSENGHELVLSFDRPQIQEEGLVALEPLGDRVTVLDTLPRRAGAYGQAVRAFRGALDYLRYLDPAFASAAHLRNRRRKALDYTPLFRSLRRYSQLPSRRVRALVSFFLAVERAIGSDPAVERALRRIAPDVVLVTPLVTAASPQTDVVKSAQRLGIPTGVCVASWDHLTTKGMMRIVPDRVFVWNEVQRREAISLHRVPPERIVVTGAQPFDRWFHREPALTREAFCAKVGLSAERPFLLFTGSTMTISHPDAEEAFVAEWIRSVRTSDVLRDYGILVRPHPYNPGTWRSSHLHDGDRVSVWPRDGANPVDEADRADYFDSLYHSAAVVGVNTSAMIEAAIVGRPVFTVVSDAFRETQTGTVHFHYLVADADGFVESAPDMSTHLRQVEAALADPARTTARREAFVDSFVRPFGRDVEAMPRLVEGIEALGKLRVEPVRTPLHLLPLRLLVRAGSGLVAVRDERHLPRAIEHRGLAMARGLEGWASSSGKGRRARTLRVWARAAKVGSRALASRLAVAPPPRTGRSPADTDG